MNWLGKYQRAALLVFAAVVATLALLATIGIAGASEWQPRDGCGHTIQRGDTLTAISGRYQVDVATIVAVNPHVHNPDKIVAGEQLDVCEPDGPILVQPPATVSDTAASWATALRATMPAESNLTGSDLLLLTALAGPESAWCTLTVNENDADPPVWGPSIGCLQTRTFLRDADLQVEPWRDRAWLEQSILHQAESAWTIYQLQGATAWGPARPDKKGRVKLPPSGRDACSEAWKPVQCRDWWDTAAAAIAVTR